MRRSRLAKLMMLMGGGKNIWWEMRDLFTTDVAAGSLNNTAAEPGTATRLVTDVESNIYTVEGWLRGGDQITSAVWGESKIVWSPALARTPGRCMVCLARPCDNSWDMAIGWASADDIDDPRVDGHGWLNENGLLKAISPGKTVMYSNDLHDVRQVVYLVGTVLCTTGAYTFISLYDEDEVGAFGNIWKVSKPKYPTALIINATKTGTTDPMFPYISYYDNGIATPYYRGHAIKDVRVVDLGNDYDMAGLALADDDFTRADSNSTMGADWTPDIGVWGISSNAAYCVSGSGYRNTWKSTASRDGIYIWRFTTPANNTNINLCLSRVSAGNYLRIECNMTGSTVSLGHITGGAFGGALYTKTKTLDENTTYQITLFVYGNNYYLLGDDVSLDGGYVWYTDAGNTHITGTGMGLGSVANGADSARFLDVTYLPLTFTLPDAIGLGAVPVLPTVAGATIAQDTFTDDDATALADHTAESGGAWTVINGTWLINNNALQIDIDSGLDGGEARAVQDLGVQDVECTLEITTPAGWDASDDLQMGEGIIGRYIDANHFISFRCRADSAQPTEGEVEVLIANGVGTAQIGGKVHLSDVGTDVYVLSTKYTLRVIFSGDMAHCYLNDHLVMDYIIPEGVNGTKFGVSQMFGEAAQAQTERATMDNWSAKALS